MHNYSITNTEIRIRVISLIAVLSAYLTFLLNPLIEKFPVAIQPLSPLAIFGILFFIFDKALWKCVPIRNMIKVPDFSGTWNGYCKSTSKKTKGKNIKTNFKIKQTFTQINIDASFNNSYSESFVANVDYVNPDRARLVYSYSNKPNGSSPKTQDKHLGTIELCLINKSKLTGNYFTDRQPQTKGTIRLKRSK